MLSPETIAEIRRLLACTTLSYHKIALRVGTSRGTVIAVACGRRVERQDDVLPEPPGPPGRCPICGARVYLPCRLCRTRQMLRKKMGTGSKPMCENDARTASGAVPLPISPPPPPDPPQGDDPLKLALKKKHRRRYREVRLWRHMAEIEMQLDPNRGRPRYSTFCRLAAAPAAAEPDVSGQVQGSSTAPSFIEH